MITPLFLSVSIRNVAPVALSAGERGVERFSSDLSSPDKRVLLNTKRLLLQDQALNPCQTVHSFPAERGECHGLAN